VTTVAWWNCFAGIAGDMALGALVDAGADLNLVERELVALPVGGWALEAEQVLRAGLAATHVRVRTRDTHVVRTYAHIVGLITEARLSDRARQRALDAFARLAEVEGRLHRRPAAQVHFHEVGGTDAIIDIVGTCVALELLGVDEVRSTPIAQGTGMVHTAHGTLPVPAPAVVELLHGVPTYGTSIQAELTTPTGAALVSTLCSGYGPLPPIEISASGFGAGSRELDGLPNVVQVVVGSLMDRSDVDPAHGQPVVMLEANVDDVTGEILGTTVAALMRGGAFDVWVTPVTGKKGRPAHVISVLADPAAVAPLRQILADETGTLGIRSQSWQRWPAERQFAEVDVDGYRVRVKRGPRRIKAEHDDAVRVAARLHLPVREVARRAEEAAHRRFDPATADDSGPDAPDGPDGPDGAAS
jgi:uncharacterized protein (TIGR00299 family) protein